MPSRSIGCAAILLCSMNISDALKTEPGAKRKKFRVA